MFSKKEAASTLMLGALGLAIHAPILAYAQTTQPNEMPGMTPSGSPSASPSSSPGVAAADLTGDKRQLFTTTFQVLNSSVQSSFPSGTATISVDGDRLGIILDVHGLSPNMMHMAHIHGGNGPQNHCPSNAVDDANGDGVVDVIEGLPAYGPILVPFDGDINTQAAGGKFAPTSDTSGNLFYVATGSVASIVKDLNTGPDPLASSGLGHLNGKPFDLSQLHVVVHGVPADTQLPATAQSITTPAGGPVPAAASLPVLCGEFSLVSGTAGAQSVGTVAPAPSATPSPSASASPSAVR